MHLVLVEVVSYIFMVFCKFLEPTWNFTILMAFDALVSNVCDGFVGLN
jgi:hypothetical protein